MNPVPTTPIRHMNPVVTTPENRLRVFLKCLLLLSLATLVFHFWPGWTPAFLESSEAYSYGILSGGSLLQAGIVLLWLIIAIGDIRRFSVLVRLLLIWTVVGAIWSALHWLEDRTPGMGWTLFGPRLIAYVVIAVLIWLLLHAATKARYTLKYLSGQQFQTMQAIAEVGVAGDSVGDKLKIQPIEVALNVDGYLESFNAKSKWVMKLVLTCLEIYPLLSFHVPLSLMQTDDRLQFLKRRFLTDVEFQYMPDWYMQLVQAAIRMAKQLCYMGYYSDPRVYKSVGYVPFSKRANLPEREKDFPINHSSASQLQVVEDKDVSASEITADVVIVGSGAGASILAHQLVARGRQVLLVEKGAFERPSSFNENEVDMVSRLYADGALQLSRDFRFQVFQGSCVGGSTVVNNAVCFETPSYILDRWIKDMGVGIDRTRYEQSLKEVYKLINVAHAPQMTLDKYLNPGGTLFAEACAALGYKKPQLDSVMANIDGCLGCGYCNIGCRYGRKLSMVDTILPQTQLATPGSLQIIAGCEVLSLNKEGKRIVSLTGQFKSGRKITIKGNTFVSSAGAISSSILLLKSKLGIANVGKKLAFNLGSQITAAYDRTVNSYDGLQISHFLETGNHHYVMETWFNPPMFQSTAMPGWFDQHFTNMLEYPNMACTGILVGTESNAEVTATGLFGRNINYIPTEQDFDSLMQGLTKVSEIYLAGGARRVMPNTFAYYEYKTTKDLVDRFRKDVKSSRDISTGTGHPQGGNVMSSDAATGVVDPEFKVFGFDNLFVCDASVFPTSLGVNPQITVMSLAHYAAPLIAQNK